MTMKIHGHVQRLRLLCKLDERLANEFEAQSHFDVIIHEQDAMLLMDRVEIRAA